MTRGRIDGRGCGRVAGLALLALLIGCGPSGNEPAAPAAGDGRILATVNGTPISERQMDEMLQAERVQASLTPAPAEGTLKDRRRQALDLLIHGELIYQAARTEGIEATAEEIDRELQAVQSQFAAQKDFEAYLAESGQTAEDLRSQAARRLVMGAYVKSITGALDVDDAAARRMYEQQKERFMTDQQVKAAQISIRVDPAAPPQVRQDCKDRLESIRTRATAGGDFAALAQAAAEAYDDCHAGELDYFSRGRLPAAAEDVVFATAVGGVTPVLETDHGYHVVKVLDRREARLRPFEEVKTSLLMLLAREQRDNDLREHVAELRRAADVVVLDEELAGS